MESLTLILSVPLTSRHGNWASPKDSLGQFDKRRLKTEVLPSHTTCSEMPFNALHPRRTGQEWLANHSWVNSYSAVKFSFRCHLLWEACQQGQSLPLHPADDLY